MKIVMKLPREPHEIPDIPWPCRDCDMCMDNLCGFHDVALVDDDYDFAEMVRCEHQRCRGLSPKQALDIHLWWHGEAELPKQTIKLLSFEPKGEAS